MQRIRHRIAIAAVVVLGAAIAAGTAGAGSGGQLRIEPAWYDGRPISFLQPSLFSAKPNGGVLGCFGLGPDLAGINRPTSPLYVIFDPTATQDHCDGDPTAFRHEHVLSVAPGDPGYTGAWTLVLLVEASPGSIDLGSRPVHHGTAGDGCDRRRHARRRHLGVLSRCPAHDGRAGHRRQLTRPGNTTRRKHAALGGRTAGGAPRHLPPSAVPAAMARCPT